MRDFAGASADWRSRFERRAQAVTVHLTQRGSRSRHALLVKAAMTDRPSVT